MVNKKIKRSVNEEGLPFVSVIVLNYNGKQHLKECFESLEKLNYPKDKYEVIMADNASSDGSVEYVTKSFPEVKVIKFNKNYGFSEGNNKAVECTKPKSEYLVFLNNDTEVDGKWLIELTSSVMKDETIKCVVGKMLNYYDRTIIDSAGDRITPIGSGYNIGHLEKDDGRYNEIKYTSACGGAMLIEKEIFNKLNGFDRDYFAYLEDVDLCWKLWLYGYKTLYIPTAIVYHKMGGSFGGGRHIPLKLYLTQKNRLSNMVKNLEIFNLFRGLIISVGYDIVKIIKHTINRKFDCVVAILKGNYMFIKELPKTLKKRKIIQKKRKRSDKELYKMGLISPLLKCIKKEINLSKRDYCGI
ncbi:MAG: hypothetical protein A7316_02775 [Candidatus Altiarchaeales archaeon WOR_SM1_86-2]|nr:MAG: hypothetical protein A7316_02775 [Candidatus Altiarchaeales archaeon WOR_SM1_86-2]